MSKQSNQNISDAISGISKDRRQGISNYEATVIGLTRGLDAAGAAIVAFGPSEENGRFLAHHSTEKLFPRPVRLMAGLQAAYFAKSDTDANCWHNTLAKSEEHETIWVIGTMLHDEDQANIGYIAVWRTQPFAHDLTSQNFLSLIGLQIETQFQQEQKESPENIELAEALDAISDGIIVYDKNGVVLAFNEKQRELFPSFATHLKQGVSYEDLLRHQLSAGQIPAAIGREEEWIAERKQSLNKHGHSVEQLFESGRTLRLTNYHTKSGGRVAIRTDITELVDARQTSAENEQLFRALLESAPIPLVIISDGIYLYANSFAHELYGVAEGQLIGQKTLSFYVREKDRARYLEQLERQSFVANYEMLFKKQDGSEIETSITSTRVTYEGKPSFFAAIIDVTEEKRIRNAILENEKQVRDVLELSPDAIVVQADGVAVYANQSAARIFAAKDAEDLIGLQTLTFVHPEEQSTILKYRDQVLSEELPAVHFDTRHQRLNGEFFYSDMSIGPVLWKGRPGTINIIRDITVRKETEAALHRRDKELALAQKLGRIGHWRLSLDSNELYWSDELYRLYGLDPNAQPLTLDYANSLTPDEDVNYLSGLYSRLKMGEQVQNFDYRIKIAGGDVKHLRGSARPEFDTGGNVISIFGVSQDITEQIRVEKARDVSNAKLKDFAELGADWFWEMDEDLRFSYFSDRIHRVTGLDTNLYIGKTREEIGQGTMDGTTWERHLDDQKNHRPFKNFRYQHVSDDGREYFWTITGKPVFDDRGNFKGYRGTGADVTAQTALEAALRQSQKIEAVGQLTGGIAHDFNNILAVIMGNTELLKEEIANQSGGGSNHIEAVLKATGRGSELTQSMLAFSRKQELRPKTVYLDKQIKSMTNILHRSLGETISIKEVHDENLWGCTADPGQVENALLNLALNARDAMPNGGKLTIETKNILLDDDYVRAQTELESGKYVMLAVSDTGTGILPDALERVFEPFYTTKEVGKGTGLGLSMVYGFAKQSRGHVTIYSEPGYGTTVKLYLPQTNHTGETAKLECHPELKTEHETLLVVEDDADMRELTVELLGNLGYTVRDAENGRDALLILEKNGPVDLILTDIVLPGGLNGVELAHKICEKYPGTKTLFMSGYTENAFSGNDMIGKNATLLNKPFRKADLAHKISQILGHSQINPSDSSH